MATSITTSANGAVIAITGNDEITVCNRPNIYNFGNLVAFISDGNTYVVTPPVTIDTVLFSGTAAQLRDKLRDEVFPDAGGAAITTLDDVPQGSTNKWFSAADYAILQQIISAFTTP